MDILKIHSEIDLCQKCRRLEPLFGFDLKKTIGIQRGNPLASVMGIGIAPSKSAAQGGLAFAGNSFDRIRKWFREAGYNLSENDLRDKLYLTSLNKCAAEPDTLKIRSKLWKGCSHFLWRQIDIVRPNLLLLFGSEVAEKISSYTGGDIELKCGTTINMQDLFAGNLFPPVDANPRILAMPHPSGLSRTMNDSHVRKRILSTLEEELQRAVF